MKKLFLAAFLISFYSFAGDGLTIHNSFKVDKEGNIYRGKEPKTLVEELAHLGFSDVIIFKNEVKNEVTKEIDNLKELGLTPHHIPFRWKDYPSMQEACEQTVEALNLIHRIKENNGKVFIHCTAGEDRTGMLAGLYRMLEERVSKTKVFQEEMCARGYSNGNPKKPGIVTGAIQKELTPLFNTLALKIERGEWKLGKISKRSCQDLTIEAIKLKCN